MHKLVSPDATITSRHLREANGGWRSSLQSYLSALLIAVVLLGGTLLTLQNYSRNTETANRNTDALFERIAHVMALELNTLFKPIEQLVDLVAKQPLTEARTLGDRLRHLPALAEILDRNPSLSSFYVGYENGDFFLVRSLGDDVAEPAKVAAPDNTAYVVQSIVVGPGGRRDAQFIYLTSSLATIKQVYRPDFNFDPRQRDWYRRAMASAQQIKTKPYVFFTMQKFGITFARRNHAGNSVVGADIALTNLSRVIARQKVTPSADLVVVDADGAALAYRKPALLVKPVQLDSGAAGFDSVTLSELGGGQFATLASRLPLQLNDDTLFPIEVDGRSWSGRIMPINHAADPLYLAIAAPRDELLGQAIPSLRTDLLTTLVMLLGSIPLAWLLAWWLGKPLRRLAGQARAMQRFDFTPSDASDSSVSEIRNLADSMEESKSTIKRFMDISSALAAEQDLDKLLERILDETISTARADMGALYLLDDAHAILNPVLAKWRNPAQTSSLSCLASLDTTHADNVCHPMLQALQSPKSTISRLQMAEAMADGWLGDIPVQLGRQEFSLMVIPLKNRQEQAIGLILLAGPVMAAQEVAHLVYFLEALSGTAAISIENKQLVKNQKNLLESFIQVMASAIDAKSPHTGAHCQRVPELTKMLAQAACDAQEGPYQDFTLNALQWEEVHIGSWLHDCGKVTTPEFIVDKATKLETIYNRINEIRMRFEVIKRDEEILCLHAIAQGGDRAQLQAALALAWQQLDDDFAFVAACNVGGEFMAPAKIERLQQIARRTWMRTLDDRIGLSWDELERKGETMTSLPVQEMLLADKPEHRIPRTEKERIAVDNPWNFKLDTPELLYNRGEIHNLRIQRGTLTAEERYKINDHMVQTIIILNSLPFPPHLRNVPEIAGGHHEKMDGTGYPKRIARHQMSPVARMMAIADIFEALTASDRPYKKAKTLSETIAIMYQMKQDQHIDPDLFDLFLRSGVYLRYAGKYMAPNLIDDVPIDSYISVAQPV